MTMLSGRARKGAVFVCLASVLVCAFLSPPAARAEPLTVLAAASLRGALDAVLDEAGVTARVSYAGSSALARQISAGAPANIFISANVGWMDALAADGDVIASSRVDLLRNRLVLVAAAWDLPPAPLTADAVQGAVGAERLAMALVDAVPAGLYGKAALISFGLWDTLASQVVQTDNVRSALALVARGEAPFGIVYATDAALEPGVALVGPFPAETHPPIVYPAAIVADGDTAAARDLLKILQSAPAQATFARYGFASAPGDGD
ncbi:molybdate ABC transporter substrate-binding protein [Acuticoccus sp. MNP-M23]|uniref:molybdate ABC transporter substrate-binding protein n=1 Tax=Acuticoccus sp. MNP-M23 TaxID=3072793 RepID=UPI002814F4BB|nr:molybdate ABC transporter substrate-binding protein [Acuticoccus sp. MNP-M23]WMS43733.1 molybdate ABC transporter substrate-binding protein [Acuticoccus sp. MNP-M23]